MNCRVIIVSKKAWIVRYKRVFYLFRTEPIWYPLRKRYNLRVAVCMSGNVSPQLEKMWRKVLKNTHKKAAICECVWETWVPIIEDDCPYCPVFSDSRTCEECGDTGKIKRVMTEEDL